MKCVRSNVAWSCGKSTPRYQLAIIKDLQVAAGNSRTPEEQAEHDVFNEPSLSFWWAYHAVSLFP